MLDDARRDPLSFVALGYDPARLTREDAIDLCLGRETRRASLLLALASDHGESFNLN